MSADTVPATGGAIELTPMAHAHVQIEFGGKVIHVDPSNLADFAKAKPADLVLVTDIHGDHMDPGAIDRVRKATTAYVAPLRSAEQLRGEVATLVFTPDRLSVVKGGPAARRAYFDRTLSRLLPSRASLPMRTR